MSLPEARPPHTGFLDRIAPEVTRLPRSGIEEVFTYGLGRQGLIPLWVGEGDLPTAGFICEAATKSLAAGETFYTYQGGIPELRSTIARYMAAHYGRPFADDPQSFGPERFFVTTGGMQALQIAIRLVAGTGDEVLVPTPAWPNFAGALIATGAVPVEVPLRFSGHGRDGAWRLDLEDLARAITPLTRALVVNSPSNPTGWTATLDDVEALLGFARRHDLWIVADEIYGRFFYGDREGRAASFHDVMRSDDRVMFVQTCSKNWSMTGWRVGWLEAPAELGQAIESLVQYSTSGVPVPTQRAAVAAIEGGEDLVLEQVARARRNRDALAEALAATGRSIRFALPQGAFYLFVGLEAFADSRSLAMRLIDEAGVGVAPGSAFGRGGEGFVRLCFARKPSDIAEVARRIVDWLGR